MKSRDGDQPSDDRVESEEAPRHDSIRASGENVGVFVSFIAGYSFGTASLWTATLVAVATFSAIKFVSFLFQLALIQLERSARRLPYRHGGTGGHPFAGFSPLTLDANSLTPKSALVARLERSAAMIRVIDLDTERIREADPVVYSSLRQALESIKGIDSFANVPGLLEAALTYSPSATKSNLASFNRKVDDIEFVLNRVMIAWDRALASASTDSRRTQLVRGARTSAT